MVKIYFLSGSWFSLAFPFACPHSLTSSAMLHFCAPAPLAWLQMGSQAHYGVSQPTIRHNTPRFATSPIFAHSGAPPSRWDLIYFFNGTQSLGTLSATPCKGCASGALASLASLRAVNTAEILRTSFYLFDMALIFAQHQKHGFFNWPIHIQKL
jgi:hypothetical protein